MHRNERAAMDGIIESGSVIQIDPAWQDQFAACLAIVDEIHVWGVQAGVPVPTENGTATAYVRLNWDNFEYIGDAIWVAIAEDEDASSDENKGS